MTIINEDEIIRSLRIEFAEEATFLLQECEEAFLKLEDPATRKDELNRIFRVAHSIKGSAAMVGLEEISKFSHTLEDCLDVLRSHPHLLDQETVSLLLSASDALKVRTESLGTQSQDRWETSSLSERLVRSTEQMRLRAAMPVEEQKAYSDDHVVTTGPIQHTVKVDALRIESALDLVGELVVIKSQILQEYSTQSSGNLRQIGILNLFDKTVRELQERTLSMRLTELRPLFLKVQRLVRDLSVKLGKPVELRLSGEDIEIDRTMIELLNDPLVHLARNAIDHGIENTERRLEHGKSEKAVISLIARQSGGRVLLEISDDGGGIDRNKILMKATEKGLLGSSQVLETMSDEQVFMLLFSPGFSTATQITDISGRGVGLDVVKSNIEKMKGVIEVSSQLGFGTQFRISLPLTTAITDGIVVVVNGVRAIVPIENIRELIEIEADTCVRLSAGTMVADIRGRTMPVAEIESLLGRLDTETWIQAQEPRGLRQRTMVAVIASLNGSFAMVIEGVIGQSQVVVKPLGPVFRQSSGLSGAAILGDGRVALVLDVDYFGRILGTRSEEPQSA